MAKRIVSTIDDSLDITPGVPNPDPEPAPDPVPDPVPEPDPAPSPAPESFSLRQYAIDQGYDPTDFADEKSLAETLFRTAERFGEIEPLAKIGSQFAPFADKLGDFQEYIKQRDEEAARLKAEEDAKAAAPPPIKWRQVEYDPQWERYCEVDERTGLYRPIHPDFAHHARKLNEAVEARRENAQRLYDLPNLLDEYFDPRQKTLHDTLLKEVEEVVEQRIQALQQQAETNAYVQERAKDFYQLDQAGNVVVGPDGYAALSPKGEAMMRYLQELREAGITDPAKLRTWAEARLAADEAAGSFGKPTPPPTEPAPAPVRKKKFMERVPQRSGTIPDDTAPAGTPQNQSATFEENADRLMQEYGINN